MLDQNFNCKIDYIVMKHGYDICMPYIVKNKSGMVTFLIIGSALMISEFFASRSTNTMLVVLSNRRIQIAREVV